MIKRLAIIDGKSVFYRGYYAMPTLSTKDGTPTGGVYGFAALALELIKKLKPDYVAVAWDKPHTNIRKRKEIYPEYKAGRKKAPDDFYTQIPILHELLQAFGWPLYELDDYEADDIMGTFAVQAAEQGIHTDLITSDLDALQIIGPKTSFYAMKKGLTNIELFNPETFTAKYGLEVEQFLDLKALQGDSSDNIPGVPGVGPKTAIELLQKYKTLEGIYENLYQIKDTLRRKLEAGKKSAYMSKEVGRIWCDAPVQLDLKAMDVNDLDVEKLATLLNKLEFKSLLRSLPTHMKRTAEEVLVAKSDINPASLVPLTDQTRVQIAMADAVVVAKMNNADWLLSYEPSSAVRVDTKAVVRLLGSVPIVAHDARVLLKDFLSQGEKVLPHIAHDTRIASFMINSLRRERELGDIAGIDLKNDDGSLTIPTLWKLYNDQQEDFKKLPIVATLAHQVDFALIPTLAHMEHYGIKLDCKFLGIMSQELGERIAAVQKQMFDMVGYEFNIGSPAQLADVLYGKLQLPTAFIKKGKTGLSTGQKELDKLRGQHPIIELIEEFRELTKLKNTYIDTLPKMVDEGSRLHTTFNQDVAATGRLSSTDPNLQNIPIRTEIGRKIRTAFVPEEGNVFVSADYSQFELRLAAVLAGDTQLIEDFNGDLDIHTKTASDTFKIPLSEVTKDQRRAAKVINFGVLYGMSPHGLAAAANMSFHDAKVFIDEYFMLRAPIRKYIDNTLEKAKEEGYVETLFGRRRPTPDVKSSNFIVRQAAQRAAANMPIQGTEADLMKMAMLEVDEQLKQGMGNGKWEMGEKAAAAPIPISNPPTPTPLGVQVLQIHDSILIECPEQNADAIGKMLKETMENIYPDLGVKLRVDVSTGKNWGEL